jgi:large subunit ribosomal protein L31
VKPETHPTYHDASVRCACGEEFVVGSTKKDIVLEICSKCHPFFTGKQKFVDTAGRVDKFFRKYGDSTPRKVTKAKKLRKLKPEELLTLDDNLLDSIEIEAGDKTSETPES